MRSWVHAESNPGGETSSAAFISDLVLVSGMGGGGAGGCDVVAARIEVAALPTYTRAVSLEVFSQNLSVPDPSLSCHVGWAH